jgi:hypothetical protein
VKQSLSSEANSRSANHGILFKWKTQRFIVVFVRVQHWLLSSHLYLGFPSVLFRSGFQIETEYRYPEKILISAVRNAAFHRAKDKYRVAKKQKIYRSISSYYL